jgi:ABC-type microcin C transport system permease subunit YejE
MAVQVALIQTGVRRNPLNDLTPREMQTLALLAQGKTNIQAPWLGLAGFFTVASMLTFLSFIGEGVRDAFDPRKTFT